MVKECPYLSLPATLTTLTTGIVHGDVKPKNILVFGESEDTIMARVADFGFSTVGLERDIQVAVSTPWVAPEVGDRDGYTLEQAKQTDIYSFGMLCLWVLFKEWIEEMARAEASGVFSKLTDAISGDPPDIRFLKDQNPTDRSKNRVQQIALDLVQEMAAEDLKPMLTKLFRATLSFDSGGRGDFSTIAHDLGKNVL